MSDIQKTEAVLRLPLVSRYTYRSHLLFAILNSIFGSIVGFQTVIARKTLSASDWQISILTTAPFCFYAIGFIVSKIMEGRSKKPFFLFSAYVGCGIYLLTYFVSSSIYFILICCISAFALSVFHPAWTSVMQANYHPQWYGRINSKVGAYAGLICMVSTLVVSVCLDENPFLYRLLFPFAGIIGFFGFLIIAELKVRRTHRKRTINKINFKLLLSSLTAMICLLRKNRLFSYYEAIFFIYGIGFMILLPINVFLLVDVFKMSYQEITLSQTICYSLGFSSFAWIAGRIFDQYRVFSATGIYFLCLSMYPVVLLISYELHWQYGLYLASFISGVAMSGVMQSWSLSSIIFSGEADAASYMGVHVTGVGIRALFGPALGVLIVSYFSITMAIAISILCYLVAGCLMFRFKDTQ